MQSTQRYVIFALLAGGVLLWATLSKLFSALAYTIDIPDPMLLGSNFTATTLIGFAIALGAGLYCFKSERTFSFCSEVAAELRKVTWPSRQETRTATTVVIVTTLIIAAILGVYDLIWGEITSYIYKTI